MAINATVTKTASGSWLFTWAVDTAPYQVWLDGRLLVDALTTESYDCIEPGYDDLPPPLEILNDGDAIENVLYPPRFVIQWRGIQSANAYFVQLWENAAWVDLVQIEESGQGYYSWESDPLADQDTHLFRVVAVNLRGDEGTPLPFTSDITRNPATPEVSFDITAGDVVVSA